MRESSGWLEANLRAAGVVMPALIQDIGHYEKARTVMTRALLTQVAVAQYSHLLDALSDFQSRIHSDPNDKPQIDVPSTTPDPAALTLTWDEIPPWQQDNEYIRTGYRRSVMFLPGVLQLHAWV